MEMPRKNLISNGGVEIDMSGWTASPSSSLNDQIGHESFASLSAVSSGGEDGFESAPVSALAGETYDASAWVNLTIPAKHFFASRI